MSKSVAQLYKYLNEKIPTSLSCEWDNDGLMCCPDSEKQVERVLIALDITERVVDYAISKNFDVIISHHPLIFKKIGQINEGIATSRKAIKLISNGISAMSFHTRLDAVSGGVNDILAKKLGLLTDSICAFGPEGEKIGRIGCLKVPVELKDFCEDIKRALGCKGVLACSSGKKVFRVALLGGDGKDFVDLAKKEGADTYVSGRISYNIMSEAPENGMNLVEAGHFFTEDPVCSVLYDIVHDFSPEIFTEHISSNEISVY